MADEDDEDNDNKAGGGLDLTSQFGGAAGGIGVFQMLFRVFETLEKEFTGGTGKDFDLGGFLRSILSPAAPQASAPQAGVQTTAGTSSGGASAVPLAPARHEKRGDGIDVPGRLYIDGDSTANRLSQEFKNSVDRGVDSAGLEKKGKQLPSLAGVDMRGAHVLVELGYNDVGKQANTSPAVMQAYHDLYKQHIDQIRADGGTPIIIGMAAAQKPLEYKKNGVPMVQTPAEFEAWNRKLTKMNDQIRAVAKEEGATYVSPLGTITTGDNTLTAGSSIVGERAADGVHYSDQGNRDMARLAARAIAMTPLMN